jgi:ABC-type nitrate/sulfonate/bicarbonate transport system permease component
MAALILVTSMQQTTERTRADAHRNMPQQTAPRHKVLRRFISPLVIVLLWQAASTFGLLSPRTLASPLQIVTTGWGLLVSGELPWHLLVSLGRVAAGLAIGLSVGVGLALVAGLSRLGEDIVDAPVQMLRALPFLALVPLDGLVRGLERRLLAWRPVSIRS